MKDSAVLECPHKRWNIDSRNIGTCANPDCGEVRQFPWDQHGKVIVLKPGRVIEKEVQRMGTKGVGPHGERHKYYEDNKEAIVADFLAIGRKATCEKWGIPRGGTLITLEKRWLTPEQRQGLNNRKRKRRKIKTARAEVARAATPKAPDNGKLPAFPAFSDSWPMMVQIKWLETYENLALSKG